MSLKPADIVEAPKPVIAVVPNVPDLRSGAITAADLVWAEFRLKHPEYYPKEFALSEYWPFPAPNVHTP